MLDKGQDVSRQMKTKKLLFKKKAQTNQVFFNKKDDLLLSTFLLYFEYNY